MIRINLLPIKQIKKRLRLRQEAIGFVLSLLVVLAVLLAVALGLNGAINSLKAEIKGLEQKKNSYTAIIKQIEQIKKEREALEAKLKAIGQLQAGSQITVRVLDEVANLTPADRMWLTSMRVAGSRLQLAGVALDNATVAQYMRGLESSPFFGVADLANSSQTTAGGQKLTSFALSIAITPPAPPEAKAPTEPPPPEPGKKR